ERVTLIGESQLSAVRRQHLRNAPGDGMVVGNAHDQATLSLHQIAARSDVLTCHGRRPTRNGVEIGRGNGLVHVLLPLESADVPQARLWLRHDNRMTGKSAALSGKSQMKWSCIKPLEHNRRIGAAETE